MEIAKLGLVMMTARILAAHQEEDGTSEQAFGQILKYSIPPILIILKENFSSAALITFTIFLMMFVGRVPKHQLLLSRHKSPVRERRVIRILAATQVRFLS